MVDAMRAMLDELMGRERDKPLDQRTGRKMRFSDPEMCKYAISGLCPYGLFKNTKSDLGLCKYEIHEETLGFEEVKADWDALTDREKDRYGYERELLLLLEQLVRDMDRKIERQKDRAEKESAPRELTEADKMRLEDIKKKEKEALEESEKLAEGEDVDGSMVLAQQAEAFKVQYDTLLKTLTAPERTMTVCDVCGVFINSTDNEQRRKDHLSGKQYLGWKAIRDTHKEVTERLQKRRESRETKPEQEKEKVKERGERDAERDRDAERPRERDRDKDRERSHSRRRRDRSPGERPRERSPRRHRSRSRDRYGRGAEVPPPGDLYRGRRRDDYRERDRDHGYQERSHRY